MAIRARLGVLVPSGNPTVEPELYRMAPPDLSVHFARLETLAGEPGAVGGMTERTLGYLDTAPAALRSLASIRPGAVLLAHTAVSYLTGFAAEPAMIERLGACSPGPLFTAARSVLAALEHLGARRIALATPYPDAIAVAGRAYWEAAGLDVVAHRQLGSVENIYEETAARALALGRDADSADAEALLISGTGLPTAGIVAALEGEIGKPVVTSQTAMLWRALRALGITTPVIGFGRLLAGDATVVPTP